MPPVNRPGPRRHPPPLGQSLLRPPMDHPLCRQHPYCWFSLHSHRLPPSCFVGRRAARALYLLHQQSRHSCRTSPRGHVGLATCLIVVDSGRGTHLPRTRIFSYCPSTRKSSTSGFDNVMFDSFEHFKSVVDVRSWKRGEQCK